MNTEHPNLEKIAEAQDANTPEDRLVETMKALAEAHRCAEEARKRT